MFDIDQDEEILILIQAAHTCYNKHIESEYTSIETLFLFLELNNALKKIEEKYGKEIFTYKGV